jgi:hypothetical protein
MYTKKVVYSFEVDAIEYQIVDWSDDLHRLEIIERQIGPDIRRSRATVVLGDTYDSGYCGLTYESESITDYESRQHAANVLAHLNAHHFIPE